MLGVWEGVRMGVILNDRGPYWQSMSALTKAIS